MFKSHNEKTVTLKLKRIEVCDLMLACTIIKHSNESTTKWGKLHDKLDDILREFDAAHPAE